MLSRRLIWALSLAFSLVAVVAFAQNAGVILDGPRPEVRSQAIFDGVARIVAIGDIHGDFDRLEALLRTARLINERDAWIGGTAHLVVTGDFLDRGPQSRKVMDLLIDLEPQAQRAGGMVHALIGNHEAMNVYGDLRYVSNADFESYRAANSKELRDQAFTLLLQDMMAKHTPPRNLEQFRKDFEKERPFGVVEQRIYFAPDGKYGKWLRAQNTVIQINDVIFVHGGISPKYEKMSFQEINDRIREELDDPTKRSTGMAEDAEGPLWYRALVESSTTNKGLISHLDRLFKLHNAHRMVIGHTIVPAILPRLGGRLIAVDVALSRVYKGTSAFLVIEGDDYYVMHMGQRVELPVDGSNPLPYLRTVQVLDPNNVNLRKLIQKGGR